MTYGTINADVIGTSVANTSLGAGNASIMKNRIINGAMVIDQRNAGGSVTIADNGFIVDRWKYQASQASKFTAGQNLNSITPPVGYSKYLGLQVASAVAIGATDYFSIKQSIEGFNIADLGWGTANAKSITLSFQVYSSLTGTFGGSLSNSGYSRSYPFTYSIPVANTWTTITLPINGDTSGTWLTNNGIGLTVEFGLGVGSTYSGTAGSWSGGAYDSATGATSVVGTNGATFYITGVQLEVGSSATGFEYRQYQQELALCQRYAIRYCGNYNYETISSGFWSNSNIVQAQVPYKVTMRSQPALTSSGTFQVIAGGTNINVTSFSVDTAASGIQTLFVNCVVASGGTTGQGSALISGGSTSASFVLSAEL